MEELTYNQEQFVFGLIKGLSQRQAYKEAFGCENWKDSSIDSKASHLFALDKIKARYNELMKELQDEAILSAKERMIWLSNVVKDVEQESIYISDRDTQVSVEIGKKNADLNTKIKAIDTLNKMDNSYQQNINISGNINPYGNLSEEELKKLAGE